MLIEFDNVGRRFNGRWAVRELSLRIDPGTVVAVLGANGAGKTTLLRLLAGWLFAQLLFAGLAMFLFNIERAGGGLAAGDALPEKAMCESLVAFVAGWSVLSFEVLAAILRDTAKLITFVRRPVSPGNLWRDLQRGGLQATPLQLLFSSWRAGHF